jgi:hypothetical protein
MLVGVIRYLHWSHILIVNIHYLPMSGQEKAIQKSKYEEDVYINNHTVSLCTLLYSLGRYSRQNGRGPRPGSN